MTQNRSSAVMQQRSEPHDSLDDFPTPPWATRALCERLYDTAPVWPLICREPAANRGYMVRPLREFFAEVVASDIHDYGEGFAIRDFLTGPDPDPVDWTITNPPFRLAQAFIRRALRTSREGVAVIVRSAFLEGIDRYHNLFAVEPPSRVMQMVERAPMVRGRLDRTAASATAYSWVVWEKRATVSTQFEWIAPCRKRLERVDDYPSDPASPTPPPLQGGCFDGPDRCKAGGDVLSDDHMTRCTACNGRGYFLCECWPGDCICGFGDEDCEECRGEGWIDTSYYEDWDEDAPH